MFDPFKPAPSPTEGGLPLHVPVDDPVFMEARRQIVEPPPAKSGGLVTVALFVLFILSQMEGLRSLPGIALLVTTLSFNLLGDSVRDALDPRGERLFRR